MNPLVPFLRGSIWVYQRVSALGPPRCRFYPSCSAYSSEALQQWGLIKGISKSMVRLLKCHPWNAGGVDPVISD